MDYSALTKDQLKDEASKRGLPVSGTVPELTERLQNHDNDDLLGGGGDDGPPSPPAAVNEASAAAAQASEPETDAEPPRTFRTRYECPGELSTGVHHDNLRRCWQEAADAGYVPRGGAFGAAMTGFVMDGGKRYAVYEINLRR